MMSGISSITLHYVLFFLLNQEQPTRVGGQQALVKLLSSQGWGCRVHRMMAAGV